MAVVPPAGRVVQAHAQPEQHRDAAHDRQPEPDALAPVALGVVELHELLEHALARLGRDARSGVDHLHVERAPGARDGAHAHLAGRGVAQRVAQQVAQQAPEQDRIGVQRRLGRLGPQGEPPRARLRQELLDESVQQRRQRDRLQRRPQRPGIEPGDVQDRLEQLLERPDRAIDHERRVLVLAAARARAQGRRVQPERVQRLAQVVARRGQEARLGEVRPALALERLLGPAALGVGAPAGLAQSVDEVRVAVAQRDRLAHVPATAARGGDREQRVDGEQRSGPAQLVRAVDGQQPRRRQRGGAQHVGQVHRRQVADHRRRPADEARHDHDRDQHREHVAGADRDVAEHPPQRPGDHRVDGGRAQPAAQVVTGLDGRSPVRGREEPDRTDGELETEPRPQEPRRERAVKQHQRGDQADRGAGERVRQVVLDQAHALGEVVLLGRCPAPPLLAHPVPRRRDAAPASSIAQPRRRSGGASAPPRPKSNRTPADVPV